MEKEQFEAGGFCDVCKMAVRYVDGILEQNATQAEIEEAVMKVCSFLPEAVRDQVHQTCHVSYIHTSYLQYFQQNNKWLITIQLKFVSNWAVVQQHVGKSLWNLFYFTQIHFVFVDSILMI